MSRNNNDVLTVAEAKIRSIRQSGHVYLDKADVVAWLRRCALESPGQIPANTASALATGLENMKQVTR